MLISIIIYINFAQDGGSWLSGGGGDSLSRVSTTRGGREGDSEGLLGRGWYARSAKPRPATAVELIETRVRPGAIPEAE